LEKALEGGKEVDPQGVETELYPIKGKSFHPCIACSHCAKHGGDCAQKDDFAELKALWLNADVILYSVPVYHMGVPGQLKCFLDRLGNSMFGLYRSQLPEGRDTLPKLLKVIGSIAQGIHVFSGQEHAITDLINHALIMQSIPVTADLWEAYIGVGGWTATSDAKDGLQSLAATGDTSAEAAVRACRAIGRRAVEMALIIQSGVLACREMLQKDPLYLPLLSRLEKKRAAL
jgi:multimeric flavodoxin WrbA